MKNNRGVVLKNKYNFGLLKAYLHPLYEKDESADINEEESMSDGSENEAILSDERPPDERPSVGEKAESADTSQEKSMSDGNENKAALSDERPCERVVSDKFASEEQFQNVWNQLPTQIVEHILVNSVMSCKSPVNTYQSV